jgi:hypothetical protein
MIACGFRRAGARRTRRLTDVFTVCDRVVALRQGQGVSVEPTARASMNAVVTHRPGLDKSVARKMACGGVTNSFVLPIYFLLPSHNSEKDQWLNKRIFGSTTASIFPRSALVSGR